MPHLIGESTITTYGSFITYVIIFISTMILGNVASFSSFWLAFFGHFGPMGIFYTLITILVEAVTVDMMWYGLGRSLHKTRLGGWIRKRIEKRKKLNISHESIVKLIVIAKLLSSVNTGVIFLAGWTKMEFKRFFKASLISIVVLFTVMLGLVSFLGSSFSPIRSIDIFKKLEFTLLLGVMISISLTLILRHLVKNKQAIKDWIQKIIKFLPNNGTSEND